VSRLPAAFTDEHRAGTWHAGRLSESGRFVSTGILLQVLDAFGRAIVEFPAATGGQ
jgi:hypothetical protein